MIDKPFSIPLDIQQLQALDRRVLPDHPGKMEITNRLNQGLAGVSGEREVFHHVKFLPQNQFRIFHNLRLHDSIGFFQIDILILTNCFILNLEVKNYKGEVYFNEFDQLVQVQADGSEKVIDENPLTQAQRHGLQLHNWLQQNNFPKIPIHSFAVFSSPTTVIRNQSENTELYKNVVSSSNILPKIHEIYSQVRTPVLGKRQLEYLVQRLLASHRPLQRNVLETFAVSYSELLKGVLCPHCPYTPMNERHGKWTCPKCHYAGSDDYLHALNDYYLLVNHTITNQEGRDFLQVTSKDKMNRLLKKAGYEFIGETSGRKYVLQYKEIPEKLREVVR